MNASRIGLAFCLQLAACSVLAQAAIPQTLRPLVFNAPASVRPGDVVGLQGAYFGDAPQVTLLGGTTQADAALPLVNSYDGQWLSFRIPEAASGALRVVVSNGEASSDALSLNGARVDHLDALQIAPGGAMRVFGRNLLLPGFVPSLRVSGAEAELDLSHSDEHMLVATAPQTLRTGTAASITVDNGNGSGPAELQRPITVVAGGKDVFGLGVGWGGAFAQLGTRVLALGESGKTVCNGQADDTPVVQAAVDQLASSGGGLVQLPAGVCRFAGSLRLQSRVVLQGRGKDATRIRYEANYPLWGRKLDLVGVNGLTLQAMRGGMESALLQDSTHTFFKDVRFEMAGGLHMFLNGNTHMVVRDSDFIQPQNPGHNGVFQMTNVGGLVFVNNSLRFAHGAPAIGQAHDAYIADNHFSRDARQGSAQAGVVHSLTLDFAYRVAVMGNRFDVLGAPIANKLRNDGETILSEGGGGQRTEALGRVASAGAQNLRDPHLALDTRFATGDGLPDNLGVAIVGGRGAGQSRRVTALAGDTLTVDTPWALVPDGSSRYVRFVWGLEKAIIQGNTLQDNPRGIWLYQTAVRDVDIVDNRISEGGGIYLRSAQNLREQLFTPMYGIRIANNQISNTTGAWRSYISVMFVRMDEEEFGVGTTGIEVRNNELLANVPNLSQPQEEAGAAEGFVSRMHTEGPSQAKSLNQARLLGTVFQGNHCSGCSIGVVVREGARATVLEGNSNTPAASAR